MDEKNICFPGPVDVSSEVNHMEEHGPISLKDGK
jgi:hypothetical protein